MPSLFFSFFFFSFSLFLFFFSCFFFFSPSLRVSLPPCPPPSHSFAPFTRSLTCLITRSLARSTDTLCSLPPSLAHSPTRLPTHWLAHLVARCISPSEALALSSSSLSPSLPPSRPHPFTHSINSLTYTWEFAPRRYPVYPDLSQLIRTYGDLSWICQNTKTG